MEEPIENKIPKERRIRTKETEGKLDDYGFFHTPNGSFWDMDGEYFNHHGFDIHGGKYVNQLDYIPGPTWIEDLGCYPEDEEKYKNEDIDDYDEDDKNMDMELDLPEGKEIEVNSGITFEMNNEQLKKCFDIGDNNKANKKGDKKDKKGKKKNKKKKEESFDEEEWEEIED